MTEEKNTKKGNMFKKPEVQSIVGVVLVFLLLGAFIFWQTSTGTVYIENAQITTPIINLSGSTPGTLNALYVKEGDVVSANTPVALVGTSNVSSKLSGIIVSTTNNIGTYYAPGMTIVSMVHPEDMRVVGAIEETKGLDEIKPGQQASFTVDTYGSKTYIGVVESVSQTSNDSGVVFSISDKRPTKKFDIKVRYSVVDYPELKNGMSAKITVYVK